MSDMFIGLLAQCVDQNKDTAELLSAMDSRIAMLESMVRLLEKRIESMEEKK